MLRDEAEMKARIEEEYRVRAETEAREKVDAEMKAQEEIAAAAAEAAAAAAEAVAEAKAAADLLETHNSSSNSSSSSGNKVSVNGSGAGVGSRGLRLTSPGGSSDGTEVNSLSARSSEGGGGKETTNQDGPPFSGGRMLDVSEAEEMNAAIKQLYLKTPSNGTPFVLFKARLRTSRREWNIERRYSDFVWLHDVRWS